VLSNFTFSVLVSAAFSLEPGAFGSGWLLEARQFGKVGWEEQKQESISDAANETLVWQEVKGEMDGELPCSSDSSRSPAEF